MALTDIFIIMAISIIVCAKNEAENITVFLPKILEQDYSDFEVILVDDQSKDNTEYVLKELTQKYSNLKIVKIAQHVKHRVGKKFALTPQETPDGLGNLLYNFLSSKKSTYRRSVAI